MNVWEVIEKNVMKVLSADICRFAIYPYGNIGKRVYDFLKAKKSSAQILCFDEYGKDNEKVLSPSFIEQYRDEGIYYLIATVKNGVREEIIYNLLNMGVPDRYIVPLYPSVNIFLDDRNNNKEIIAVSLTSFPKRIEQVEETIKSLQKQTLQPDKIILWLAKEEFESKQRLPRNLLERQDGVFEIAWCKNWGSYKKLVPALFEYEDYVLVTADDDLLYDENWLKLLYDTHLRYPRDIITHRVTKIVKDINSRWATVPGGYEYYSGACALNKLCGGSGTLYPLGSFDSEVRREDRFMKLAPTSDDLWFWLMGLRNGRYVRAAYNCQNKLNENPNVRNTPKLTNINDRGEKLFWIQFYNILDNYPELIHILENEYNLRKGLLD